MSTRLAAIAALALVVAQGAAAQVTFYSREGFVGRSYSVGGADPDLGYSGFGDRASSAIVERGRWELCEHPGFTGRCVVLGAGQYPSLAAMGLDNRVSSTRPVRGRPSTAYVPPPPPAPAYAYYPRHGERIYQASVTGVRVVVGPPEQRCWVERQVVRGPNVPGAILGGIIGGVLGHQIGSGSGRDVATAVGAIGGAAVGANVRPGTYAQDVQRCEVVPGSAQPAYWDVTYVFRGREYRAQLGFEPGPTIPVNHRGEPRV